MGPLLRNHSIPQKQDAITEACRGQPVGNKQRRAFLGHFIVFMVDVAFRQGVQGRGGLVQGQDGAAFVQGPGQHQPLGLSAGKLHAVLVHLPAQMGMDSLGQRPHRLRQPRLLQASPYAALVDAVHPLGHVFRHAGLQQGKLLKHSGEQPVIVPAVQLPDVPAVEQHPSPRGVQETAHQLDQGGFSRAVQAHNGQLFPRADGQGKIAQGVLFRAGIAEGHILQANLIVPAGFRPHRLAALQAEGFGPLQEFPQAGKIEAFPVQRRKPLH